ncbi:thymidylate kinase isoform X3 [Enhydra lutris kenyoni]|uniref:Thymidylate kinase isoform X3 n=1 Tax=Enhydra lutris kenyoni TaxID=391180 RepID=A0A2Y9IXW2_ENHLU|nr:thymidylate kinase isoform X3 [Enhydra lutris kenyoni]
MAARRGALIVLEGVDRAGKSTQSRKLVAALCAAGHRAELLRFPERSTEIGRLLSSYLEEKRELEDHSNFSLDWCKQPDVGLPKPDLVVFLQLRLAEAAARGEFGRERYENGNFQERALRCFHQLMADETLNWKMVDASKSIEDVHKEIHALSVDTIQAVTQRPLGELWK